MGICCSKVCLGEDKRNKNREERVFNAKIEEELNVAANEEQAISKLLFLGAGESGKSTLFKQLSIVYGSGFTENDCIGYIPIINHNVISILRILSDNVRNIESVKIQDAIEKINKIELNVSLSTIHEEAKVIWNNDKVQEFYANNINIHIPDSCAYFLNQLDIICQANYIPTIQDILRSRVRTTGIVEKEFIIHHHKFRIYDVGGQRNERKKWIHCFENVTAVVFVAALSSYDQILFEDESTYRIDEALNLFNEICNSEWFVNTSMILFLNKRDLFEEKLLGKNGPPRPITMCPSLSHYDGDEKDIEASITFIEDLFLMKNSNPDKQVYYHVTTATDTSNTEAVFAAVKDIIIRKNLYDADLF